MSKKTLLVGVSLITALMVAGVPSSFAQSQAMSETDYDAAMKVVRTSFTDLKKHLDAKAGTEAAAEAAKLLDIFKKAEGFWAAQKVQPAIDFSKAAQAAAASAEKAAKGGDFSGALEAHKTLQAACQSCHTQYREKAEDGSYRIKKPVS